MKSPLSPGGLVHCQTEAFSHQPSAISYRLTTCTDFPILMRDQIGESGADGGPDGEGIRGRLQAVVSMR